MIDRVSHLSTDSQETANANGRPLLSKLVTLQILHHYLFKFANGIVMHLNQTGEIFQTSTDVHIGDRIRDMDGIEESPDAFFRP
jgi:hypothetical protein